VALVRRNGGKFVGYAPPKEETKKGNRQRDSSSVVRPQGKPSTAGCPPNDKGSKAVAALL